jgi:hypothetical protein
LWSFRGRKNFNGGRLWTSKVCWWIVEKAAAVAVGDGVGSSMAALSGWSVTLGELVGSGVELGELTPAFSLVVGQVSVPAECAGFEDILVVGLNRGERVNADRGGAGNGSSACAGKDDVADFTSGLCDQGPKDYLGHNADDNWWYERRVKGKMYLRKLGG